MTELKALFITETVDVIPGLAEHRRGLPDPDRGGLHPGPDVSWCLGQPEVAKVSPDSGADRQHPQPVPQQ